jgi:hypothetical protein
MGGMLSLARLGIPVLLTIFTLFVEAANAQVRGSELDSILNQFPGYRLLTLQDRDAETRSFIVQHSWKYEASVVHADFDGDGRPDYALLLKNKGSENSKLVMLLCPSSGSCKSVYESDLSAVSTIVYIRPLPPGSRVSETEAEPGHGPPVKLDSAGVRLDYFGKGETVLYWNKKLKKIEELETED